MLSEIRSTSLADMMKDAIEVEVNLSTARKKKRDEGDERREEGDRRKDKETKQPSSYNSQEVRMDMMIKAMENLMEILSMDNKSPPRENQEQQNRNQNVRRPQALQNRQRDQRNPPGQPVKPPFHKNYVEQEYGNEAEGEIHQLDTDSSYGYFTKEGHDNSLHEAEGFPTEET